jgi:hypothetical protein
MVLTTKHFQIIIKNSRVLQNIPYFGFLCMYTLRQPWHLYICDYFLGHHGIMRKGSILQTKGAVT